MSVVRPYPNIKGEGLRFPKTNDEYPGATVDDLYGSEFLREIYLRADKDYKGPYSVPVLWDKETETIVSNDSAEMLRWLPNAFDPILPVVHKRTHLYPDTLRSRIDEITAWMQPDLNAGVYKAGGAATQADYDKAVPAVFRALNRLEQLIHDNGGPFILGKHISEVDLRAYTTIIRFDPIYVQHCKCNLGTIRHNYPTINNWLKNLYYNVEGFRETTNFKHIKESCRCNLRELHIIHPLTSDRSQEPSRHKSKRYRPHGPYTRYRVRCGPQLGSGENWFYLCLGCCLFCPVTGK
jgi:putative glutathione S-transferase